MVQVSGMNPLVRRLNLQEILERDAEPAPAVSPIDDIGTYSALASQVRAAWGRNKLAKQRVDLKLLDCLRARRGLYSPAALSAMQAANQGMNIVFTDLTETKCRAASAWIRDVVLPAGERPWAIEPTPVPDLPMSIKQGVVKKALQTAQQIMQQSAQAEGGQPMSQDDFRELVVYLGDQLKDEAEKQYQKLADRRAKRMETVVADRMDEGGFDKAMDEFVEDFVTYPAAILKGPIYTRHKRLKWGDDWTPLVDNTPIQYWERVSPFDIYPAPAARDCQQGDFIERLRFRRDELFDLKGLPGYKDDQIDGALLDYSNGHLEGWLWTEAERNRLEQETMYLWLSPPGVIDALSYWGSVPGWKLMSWGVTGKDGAPLEDTRDYECNIVVCGKYILYAALNPHPLNWRPYRKACYDEIPGAFWGRSIPDLAQTSQKLCNGIACALADNLSMASGPMVWVHADRFADGEQTLEIFPWKIWQLKSDATQGVNPGIGFFQPNDNSASLMATYNQWEQKADDATGIPRYTYGNEKVGGAGGTATGLSMLLNSAAKGLRRAISNIDINVIAPNVEQAFVNEMLYNQDDSIKGDCNIVPRGAAAILIKEAAQQRRTQFMGMTANPIDMAIIGQKGRAALLRETASALELPVDDIIPTDADLEKQQAQQAQMQQQQLQMAQQAAQQKQQGDVQQIQAKEAAIGQRVQQQEQTRIVGKIAQDAVQASLAGKPMGTDAAATAARQAQASAQSATAALGG